MNKATPISAGSVSSARHNLKPFDTKNLLKHLQETEPDLHAMVSKCCKTAAAAVKKHGGTVESVAAVRAAIVEATAIAIEALSLKHHRQLQDRASEGRYKPTQSKADRGKVLAETVVVIDAGAAVTNHEPAIKTIYLTFEREGGLWSCLMTQPEAILLARKMAVALRSTGVEEAWREFERMQEQTMQTRRRDGTGRRR